MTARGVSRTLSAVLIFQLGIGLLLIFGDMQSSTLALPRLSPDAPRLDAPIRPGDQRRVFNPGRDRPAVSPARDPGTLPDRLVLTRDTESWRLEGAIAVDDAQRLIAQLDAAEPPVEALILQSPGGSVPDALELGRHLRARGIATQMLAGEICFSACPYVLVGGQSRDIAPEALVGVHQHYFGESTLLPAYLAVEDIQRGQADVMSYLADMGIDPLVMRHAMSTPPDEIYVLVPEELQRYGFIPREPD